MLTGHAGAHMTKLKLLNITVIEHPVFNDLSVSLITHLLKNTELPNMRPQVMWLLLIQMILLPFL